MVTPYRSTHFRLDIGVPHVAEPAFSNGRRGGEIARGGKLATGSTDVKLTATGAWIVSPLDDKPNFATRTDNNIGLLRLSDFNVSADMDERPMFRSPADLTGVTVNSNVSATGNYYFVRKVGSSGSWHATLSADEAALPAPTLPEGSDVSKSRKAVSKATYSIYQGWQINLFVPASQSANKAQFLFGFSFNSIPSSTAGATGVYYLAFLYSGTALLYEQVSSTNQDTGATTNSWSAAYEWLFAPVTRNYGLNFTCRIIPHLKLVQTPGRAGQTFDSAFLLFQMDAAEQSSNTMADPFSKLSQAAGGNHNYSSVYTFRAKENLQISDIPGVIRVDMPDDSKAPFQIVQLKYAPAGGNLVDYPIHVPWAQSQSATLKLYWNAWLPFGGDNAGTGLATGLTLEGFLYDATTGEELTQSGSGGTGTSNFKEYVMNPGQANYYASFTFTPSSDGNLSPFLWNYVLIRDAVFNTHALPEIRVPEDFPNAKIAEVSISGAERDVTHEGLRMQIKDLGNDLSYPLTLRAGSRSQLWTSYDPNDPTKRSILFDGYVDRPEAMRVGSGTQAFPSPLWNAYDINFVGMWTRLKETLTSQIYLISGQPDPDNSGRLVFSKVTDLCRALLETAGFDHTQIDIPDSPITFAGQNGNPGVLDSLTPVLDAVTKFLQDYLGWYLAWCPNSGLEAGMWRAIQPTPLFATYTNLAVFTMDGPGNGKLAFRPESYGSTNWCTAADGTVPTLPIRKKTLHYFPVKPEGNSVLVTGTSSLTPSGDGTKRVVAEMRNLKSYDSVWGELGYLSTADPLSADFLGRHIPIYVVMFGIEQAAADAICRRVYDVSCHGYEVFTFQAPLALVVDPNDTNQVNPRPLRYLDPVQVIVDGNPIQFLVRNCNPMWTKDRVQMAQYELQTPFENN